MKFLPFLLLCMAKSVLRVVAYVAATLGVIAAVFYLTSRYSWASVLASIIGVVVVLALVFIFGVFIADYVYEKKRIWKSLPRR